MNEELYHYGVKGMKWGVIRNRMQTAVSNKINKKLESRSEHLKDQHASRDPISKQRREQSKERRKKQAEMAEIRQAKGKDKVAKILAKIGRDALNDLVVDRPTGPNRKPWDEKPNRGYEGRI